MKFRLEIDLDNDAFQPTMKPEIMRILDDVRTRLWQGRESGNVRDAKGIIVGDFRIIASRKTTRG